MTPRVRGSADERHPGTRPPDRWPARRPEERSCSQKLLEASGALIRACLLIIPDFVANLFEKPAQFLVGHAACFDLTAEWLECLVRCSLAADVLLDQIVDVDRQILPNLCGSLGEPALSKAGATCYPHVVCGGLHPPYKWLTGARPWYEQIARNPGVPLSRSADRGIISAWTRRSRVPSQEANDQGVIRHGTHYTRQRAIRHGGNSPRIPRARGGRHLVFSRFAAASAGRRQVIPRNPEAGQCLVPQEHQLSAGRGPFEGRRPG